MILLDDHLVRDLIAGEVGDEIAGYDDDFATTNLWLVRLVGAFTREAGAGSLSGPLKHRGADAVARFRDQLAERLGLLTVVPIVQIVWQMASLQERHRAEGRRLSTAMAEALAAAHELGAGIAVASVDVGPGLRAAADADDIAFTVVHR